jgi:hypothetical protein
MHSSRIKGDVSKEEKKEKLKAQKLNKEKEKKGTQRVDHIPNSSSRMVQQTIDLGTSLISIPIKSNPIISCE